MESKVQNINCYFWNWTFNILGIISTEKQCYYSLFIVSLSQLLISSQGIYWTNQVTNFNQLFTCEVNISWINKICHSFINLSSMHIFWAKTRNRETIRVERDYKGMEGGLFSFLKHSLVISWSVLGRLTDWLTITISVTSWLIVSQKYDLLTDCQGGTDRKWGLNAWVALCN